MSTAKMLTTCQRILSVVGLVGKYNDVITCGDFEKTKEHVIYFGGDVQDYKENMDSHRDNKRFSMWNLENTAILLQSKFPDAGIIVIKPARMHLKTFSVYTNFVESNDFGCPTHSSNHGALSHLYNLYQNILTTPENKSDKSLTLIGFSKGCIVLNQLVYELIDLKDANSDIKEFVNSIKGFYWLDGGHSGGKHTWVTDNAALQALSQLHCKIVVHVTPYQVKDQMRSWIGREEKHFVKTLKKYGADISETLHFESEDRCIENHFNILTVFR